MSVVFCCKGCGYEKPRTSEFWHRDKNVPDGFCRKCKACRNSYHDAWYEKNKDRVAVTQEAWKQRNLSRVAENQARYARENAERLREYKKAWREENIERVRDNHNRYYRENKELYRLSQNRRRKQNPEARRSESDRYRRNNLEKYRAASLRRRARKAGAEGSFDLSDIREILNSQNGRCFWCNEVMPEGRYTIDHLIPLSRGGTNWPANLVCACHRCNSQKGARTPDEYRAYLEEYASL